MHHKTHGLIAFAIIENGRPNQPQPSLYELRKRQDQAIKAILE